MEEKEMNTETVSRAEVQQEQMHSLLFSRELGWQEIIYDLINTEQLDPWNIDIVVLTNKYLEKIMEMEENDFFVSSKVLLAASLLLRIKSEILLNRYMKSIDDILFNRRDESRKAFERLELDDGVPELIPRSPMPRFKKVTLQELMESLSKAIKTENRRIKKVIINKNALRESSISMPKGKTISIKDKIKEVFEKINKHLNSSISKKMKFEHLAGTEKDEKIACFYPILQLENNNKLWLEQEAHFDEIHIWLKEIYLKENGEPYADLYQRLEDDMEEEIEKDLKKEIKREARKLKKEERVEELKEELQEDSEELEEESEDN